MWCAWVVVPAAALIVPLMVPPLARPAPRESPAQEASPQEEPREPIIEDIAEPSMMPAAGARPLTPLANAGLIGTTLRARQSPFLVARPDGRSLLGCIESDLGDGDVIELRDVAPGEKAPDAGRAVDAARNEIVRPVAAFDGKGRLHVLWTGLVGGSAQLFGAVETEGGFAAPAVLTNGSLPNMNPEVVRHTDGRVWVAWEADVASEGGGRPNRDVLVAPMNDDGTLGAPVRIGDGPYSDVDAVVASSGGRLWIGWAGYTGRDYEIRLRSLDPGSGALGTTIEVSADLRSDDVHPTLAASPTGELWLAWDRVQINHRGNAARQSLRILPPSDLLDATVHCACVRPDAEIKVRVPASGSEEIPDGVVAGAPLHSMGGGSPRLAFDASGRLWIAYRYLRRIGGKARHEYGYPVLVQRLDADGWSAPLEVDQSAGTPEQPAIVPERDGVLVAFFCDDRLDLTRDESRRPPPKVVEPLAAMGVQCKRWNGVAAIGLARAAAPAPAATDGGELKLVRRPQKLDHPHYHPSGAAIDAKDPFISGERHFELARGETKWSVWWGDLHRHSSVSRCSNGMEPTPTDRWVCGRDVHLCDFMALTDHTLEIDAFSWWQLDKLGWLYRSPTFCTLLGWEWSPGKWGHHNVIFPGRMSTLVNEYKTMDMLYDKLQPGECVTIPHHPSDKKFPNDFTVVDDRFTRLIEIYQALRGNYEFDGCFRQAPHAGALGSFAQDALDQGHKFGIIASTDHGYGASYACVISERLDRKSLFEALLARRTYGATVKGIFVDFRVNAAVMGEEIEVAGAPKLKLVARGAAELADVVVFRNGELFRSLRTKSGVANPFTPLRLVARVGPAGAASPPSFTLRVRAQGASFDPVDDLRRSGEKKTTPRWSAKGEEALFTFPEGAARAAFSLDYPIHFFAPADAPITVTTPDGEKTLTCGELLDHPVVGSAAGGAACTLSLVPSDAVVDLEHGLGTREFTGEWEDSELRAGTSYYYARVIQVDGEMAWSSPVFVTKR